MTIPSSTYRLQIRAGFTLDEAAALAGYLRSLGVGAIYLSPILQSTTGSDHGYDTTDVTRVDLARGGQQGLDALLASAQAQELGVVVDIVPNHLGISAPAENPAWWDVLRLGEASPYAEWFDIDWTRGRLVVPVLGDDATLSLQDGELRYFEHRFPLTPGSWSPGDDPDDVHARQHYELVHHSRANSDLNYRRFFAVTTLAGVRVELPDVFEATHARVADWVQAGVTGLRIDHPDGLVDPRQYLERLRALAPQQWITVEKILEPGEVLPTSWPVAGTTGYDAMREVNGVFLDPATEPALTELYRELTGDHRTLGEHVEDGKRMVVNELLPAEVRRIAALAPDVDDAAAAIAEIAVAFEVYRSYLPEGTDDLDHALRIAADRRPDLAAPLDALRPRLQDPADEIARRMQQLSGATMAKGVEDTAYYRYARFIALNEVGGNPDQVGISLEDFHALQVARQGVQPLSMTSLSTHDTKRSEDVRARLAAVAEVLPQWGAFAEAFLARADIPGTSFGYFLAQTLAGAGPIERSRMHAYAEKAMREASQQTTWTAPDDEFEAAVHAAVDLAYDDAVVRGQWDTLTAAVQVAGWSNSLGQKLIQLTMPGIPDVYQGTELWDYSLVDPDNRRSVDFAGRAAALAALREVPAHEPPAIAADGVAKLWVTATALRLRRDHPELFTSYASVAVRGTAAPHAVAFDRGGAVTVATRLPLGLAAIGGWGDAVLELAGSWIDLLTGTVVDGPVLLGDLLTRYPVALLTR